MRREDAEAFALDALAWILAREDLQSVFFGSTGLNAADLRDRAGDPELLAAVLDFLTMDDNWVQDFCTDRGHAFDLPMAARAALPGGDLPHWT